MQRCGWTHGSLALTAAEAPAVAKLTADGIVWENPGGADGRLTNPDGSVELPGDDDGGCDADAAGWGGGAVVFVVLVDEPEALAC